MILRDLHLHTDFSDGQDTMEAMAETAVRLGYRDICFTDHVRRNSDWVGAYYEACRAVTARFAGRLRIRCGVEAKVCDFRGTLDLPPALPEDVERVAAIHRLPDGQGGFTRAAELRERGAQAVEEWFRTVEGLRHNPRIDRLAHPFSLLPSLPVTPDTAFWARFTAAAEGTAYLLEYNVKYDNSAVPRSLWAHFAPRLVPGSDSHSVTDMAARRAALESFAAERAK